MTRAAQEYKAVKIGKLDGTLSVIFMVVGIAAVELLAWAVTIIPYLDSYQGGKYAWLKVPIGIILGAILKGVDRKRHEDPSPRTGLIDVEV